VLEAIAQAASVVLCPSNPVTSIGSILSVPGIRPALTRTKATIAGVSPIIGTAAISGPAHDLMVAAGFERSALGVAKAYADFLDLFLIAEEDRALTADLGQLGIGAVPTDIRMRDHQDKIRLARELLALLDK
jgi:LPPG:FO 2-phospho-L-lactate transferase